MVNFDSVDRLVAHCGEVLNILKYSSAERHLAFTGAYQLNGVTVVYFSRFILGG